MEGLWAEVQDLDYSYTRSGVWYKNYSIDSGELLEGPAYSTLDSDSPIQGPYIRKFIDQVFQAGPCLEEILGKYKVDWEYFTARPNLYPADTGLSWHEDGGKKAGAFVYYAHPKWGARWGGELLIATPPDQSILEKARVLQGNRKPYFETNILDYVLDYPAVGTYIAPRPNRFVVIKGGAWHCVRRVEPAAGDNLRVSISGFFSLMRP